MMLCRTKVSCIASEKREAKRPKPRSPQSSRPTQLREESGVSAKTGVPAKACSLSWKGRNRNLSSV